VVEGEVDEAADEWKIFPSEDVGFDHKDDGAVGKVREFVAESRKVFAGCDRFDVTSFAGHHFAVEVGDENFDHRGDWDSEDETEYATKTRSGDNHEDHEQGVEMNDPTDNQGDNKGVFKLT
jgi:hypothetical protein